MCQAWSSVADAFFHTARFAGTSLNKAHPPVSVLRLASSPRLPSRLSSTHTAILDWAPRIGAATQKSWHVFSPAGFDHLRGFQFTHCDTGLGTRSLAQHHRSQGRSFSWTRPPSRLSRHPLRFWLGQPELAQHPRSRGGRSLSRFRTPPIYPQVTYCGTGSGTRLLAQHHMGRCLHWSDDTDATMLERQHHRYPKNTKKKMKMKKRLTTFSWQTGLLLQTHSFSSTFLPTSTLLLSANTHCGTGLANQ